MYKFILRIIYFLPWIFGRRKFNSYITSFLEYLTYSNIDTTRVLNLLNELYMGDLPDEHFETVTQLELLNISQKEMMDKFNDYLSLECKQPTLIKYIEMVQFIKEHETLREKQ